MSGLRPLCAKPFVVLPAHRLAIANWDEKDMAHSAGAATVSIFGLPCLRQQHVRGAARRITAYVIATRAFLSAFAERIRTAANRRHDEV